MFQATTITSKWQMTLPKKVRESLGLKEPGAFLVDVVDRKKKLIRIKKKKSILDLAGSIPLRNKKGKKLNVLKIRDMMEKNYERA